MKQDSSLTISQAASNSLQDEIMTLRKQLETKYSAYSIIVRSVTDVADNLVLLDSLHNEIISILKSIQSKRAILTTYRIR